MPLYEYKCNKCGNKFSKIIFNRNVDITCSICNSKDVKKLMSVFAMSGSTSGSSCASCSSPHCSTCGH